MQSNIYKRYLVIVAALVIIISGFGCSSSRSTVGVEEGWDLLGEMKVNFVRDRDALEIRNSNPYTAVRFKIEDRDVRLNDLTVFYVNGDKLSPAIDDIISAGQYSRVIELAADGKTLSRISFKYRTEGSVIQGRGRVLVFGKRYRPGY